ncbi:uncharacterized protein LOC120010459 [Tripterygium wilfordii]|uniref:uncharacterized protein LOC120010459 n=1 Tax=Tripterygium wilfordii TaxID=458696 RepID=UPI0018F7F451|nr:uncharacterized protein LOC120010459 [Tripterygium wilfordii]
MNQVTTELAKIKFLSQRSLVLKQSLSETLTRYYPLAGKIKDDRSIDCNDDGYKTGLIKQCNSVSVSPLQLILIWLQESTGRPQPRSTTMVVAEAWENWSHPWWPPRTAVGGVDVGYMVFIKDFLEFVSTRSEIINLSSQNPMESTVDGWGLIVVLRSRALLCRYVIVPNEGRRRNLNFCHKKKNKRRSMLRENLKALLSNGLCKNRSALGYTLRTFSIIDGPYFNLVEGCLTLIQSYQTQKNFTYDWIVRTRVDSYWNAQLGPENFIPGQYVVPSGSTYGGLNDRFGVGDLKTTSVALSRLSLVPVLDLAGFRRLNSETAFKAQLTTHGIPYLTNRFPFCIVTDRKYFFPRNRFGVPVAALSSPGPLSGAKCRPCRPVCRGSCVKAVMSRLRRSWSWTNWGNETLQLCNAHGEWERGWERVFDIVAGERFAAERKRVREMKLNECVSDFEEMQRRALNWNSPPAEEICKLGLET